MSAAEESVPMLDDVLLYELPHEYCREVMTIKQDAAATEGLAIGQVLEDDTGLIPVATGANAEAVLLEPVTLADLQAAAQERVCLVRGPAIINRSNLVIATGQEATSLAALLALGMVARAEETNLDEGCT